MVGKFFNILPSWNLNAKTTTTTTIKSKRWKIDRFWLQNTIFRSNWASLEEKNNNTHKHTPKLKETNN